jgi:hypothetical protein
VSSSAIRIVPCAEARKIPSTTRRSSSPRLRGAIRSTSNGRCSCSRKKGTVDLPFEIRTANTAPTGFGSQASLFEITFEGLAGAAPATVRMREMAAGPE